MQVIVENLLKLAQDLPLTLDVEEKSISRIFEYFSMHVLKEREIGYQGKKVALDGRIQKDLFMTMILDPDNSYLHPNKVDKAMFGIGNERSVNSGAYIAFKNSYNFKKYGKKDEKKLTEICDRLIEDADRRNRGDFYTPTIFVDEAHKLLTEQLGEDWKEKYIVFDCAAGTKNLTRDYKFTELYSSTLEEGDLRIGERYNRGNKSFQYDFLNDDVELLDKLLKKKEEGHVLTEDDFKGSKLYLLAPELINSLLTGKPLLFFINPPYGTAGNKKVANDKTDTEKSKTGIAKNKVNDLMASAKIGQCTKQLYAQFIWVISIYKQLFENVQFSIFCPSQLLTSWDNVKLLRYLEEMNLKFNKGFMLQASQFADVSGNWSIMFGLFNHIGNPTELMVKDVNVDKVLDIGNHKLYMLDKKEKCATWCTEPLSKLEKTRDDCYLSSALKAHSHSKSNATIKNNIGGFLCDSNNVNCNNQGVSLGSKMFSSAASKSLGVENFERAISFFTARRLITGQYATWINWQDEYMIPNIEHPNYKQWLSDCIVYSLFNTKSNQSALRKIYYNDKEWDVLNHFFFMSVEEMNKLASGHYNSDDLNRQIEDDIDDFGDERFIYKKLQEVTLSTDAQAVLDKAKELVRLSFKNREIFNMKHPEYHLNTWDAGFYQIKALLKEYHKDELKEFNKLYKELEDRMMPLVYELGFLYK